MNKPTLSTLKILKQCAENVSINLQAPDAPAALRDLAEALEWVNGEIESNDTNS